MKTASKSKFRRIFSGPPIYSEMERGPPEKTKTKY